MFVFDKLEMVNYLVFMELFLGDVIEFGFVGYIDFLDYGVCCEVCIKVGILMVLVMGYFVEGGVEEELCVGNCF